MPRLSGAIQPLGNRQSLIGRLRPKGRNREQLVQALTVWEQNGRPSENRSEAARKIIECFNTHAPSLRLSSFALENLPEQIGNLTWLKFLYLDNNQLTELPASIGKLARLKSLWIDNNQLTELPAFIGKLARLKSLWLDNNRLSGLPAFIGKLARLSNLSLNNNQLTELPTSIGKLARLSNLYLNNNQLTTLPTSISNMSLLKQLHLDNNQLTTLPQGIFRLPRTVNINLEQNPLSQQAIVELSQQTAGPRINFSIFEAAAGRQRQVDLESVVRHYCGQIEPDKLANLQNTENADAFGRLLARLPRTAEAQLLARLANTAEARYLGFQKRVVDVVETLAEAGSAELRANCYLQAQQGLISCSDRVAITFSDIEVACKVHRISQAGGGHEQVADLLKGLFRMDALDNFARTDITGRQGGIDQIEVFLAYRVGLKDELHLPCETGAMLYKAMSGVDRQMLERAKAHVLAAESADNGANLVEFAIAQPFWKEYMESNPFYRQAVQLIKEDSQARLADLDNQRETILDAGYFSQLDRILAQREQQLKERLREYTREMIPR